MNTTKTLMLAALAAISLSAGSAMAQEGGGPSMTTVDFWAAKTIATRQASVADANRVQAGSSDVETTRPMAPVHFDYTTLANPG